MFRNSSLLLLAALLGGCTATHTFEIVVRNQTNDTLVIGHIKRGGPFEAKWATPEEMAEAVTATREHVWGGIIPPGKTAESGPVVGKFSAGANAWLLVYRGDLTLSQILATSPGNPGRIILFLDLGRNEFIITERYGELKAERVQSPLSPGER